MATPYIDVLHVRFSRAVEDGVAAAGTAGTQLSVAQREDYLNRAINDLVLNIYASAGPDRVRDLFQGLVATQTIATFSSSGVSLDVDASSIIKMLIPVSLSKTGVTTVFVYYTRKEELDADTNPHITAAAFTILNGKIYVYQNGSILSTGGGTFYYVAKSVAVQGTTDTPVNPGLFDHIIDYAATLFFEETGEIPSAAARAERVKITNAILGLKA